MIESVTHRRRAVIIDDDTALTAFVRELLSDDGFDVVVHPRWHDAHRVVAEHQPDIVLVDLKFGGLELGWQVVDRLTLDPMTRHIPVIVWSAALESLKAHEPVLLAAHGQYIIGKPFDIDVLLQTIERALLDHPRLDRRTDDVTRTGASDARQNMSLLQPINSIDGQSRLTAINT
jgi:CheY-like chemotaxis protein